jgi:hypothetical protein
MRGNPARLFTPTSASITLCLTLAIISGAPGRAMAQQEPSPSPSEAARESGQTQQEAPSFVGGPSHERRRELYDEAKLDHRRAMLYSAALPGLGNFYADRIFRGATWMGIFGMSIFCGLAGWRTSDNRLVILGISGGVVSYAGGLVTSYRDVTSYNETLRRRYKVHDVNQTTRAPVGIGYTWRF